MTDRYYIIRTYCSVHNKKTKELADILKNFSRAEVEFSDSFTPHDFFNAIKEVVFRINNKHRGRYIKVEMMNSNITEYITYLFTDNPNNSEIVASISLSPIQKIISSL